MLFENFIFSRKSLLTLQSDFDLGLYYNRARYLDVNRGRFWSQDSFEGTNKEPLSLHKYLYAQTNPVNNSDPSGYFSTGKLAAALVIQTVLVTIAVLNLSIGYREGEKLRTSREQTKLKVEQEADIQKCKGNILFHYTNRNAAFDILESQEMFITRQHGPYPVGAYTTDIAPWDPNYDQISLAKAIYFNPNRQTVADVSWFVALCNDTRPPFVQLQFDPIQWVKKAPIRNGATPVFAILAFKNPMPYEIIQQ